MSNKSKTTEKHKGVVVKKIIFLIGVILFFSNIFVYGQEDAETQDINIQPDRTSNREIESKLNEKLQEEDFIYLSTLSEKSLEPQRYKLIKEAVRDLTQFCKKSFTKESDFNTEVIPKVKGYFSRYIDPDNIGELLILENEVFKNREGEYLDKCDICIVFMIQDWFEKNTSLSPKKLFYELAIISNSNIEDDLRGIFIGHAMMSIRNLHSKGITIPNTLKKRAADIISKLFNDKDNILSMRYSALEALIEIGENEETIDAIISALDDKEKTLVDNAVTGSTRYKTNAKIQAKLLYIMDNNENYSSELIITAAFILAREKNKKAIDKLFERLNVTTDVEEFKTIAFNIQGVINEPSVLEPILENYNRLAIKDRSFYRLIETPLLIEYIKKTEDNYVKQAVKILHNKLYSLAAYSESDVPKYDAAVAALSNRLNHDNPEIRREIILTLSDMASQGLRDKKLKDDKVYDKIVNVLSIHLEQEKDTELKILAQKQIDNMQNLKEIKERQGE